VQEAGLNGQRQIGNISGEQRDPGVPAIRIGLACVRDQIELGRGARRR